MAAFSPNHGWITGLARPAAFAGATLLLAGAVLGCAWRALRAERKRGRMLQLLLRREEDFNATFENAAIGIAHLALDGRWIRVNRKLCEILGYDREALMKLRFQDVTHPDDLPLNEVLVRRLIAGDIPDFTMEKRYLKKDGEVIWGNVTCALLRSREGDRRYSIVTVEEITARKRAEEEVARQKAQAEAASEMKDRILSVISHELRTPLTPVLAALSAFRGRNAEEEQTLALIRRNVEHEICLVDDLLDATRLSHGKLRLTKSALDLHTLIHEVAASIRGPLTARDLSLELKLDASHATLAGDAARLRQVLLNLLDNARKFTPSGGKIRLSTHGGEGELTVRVTNTGSGISRENADRIFEAFEQGASAHRQQGGLGLGLAIARGLVEGHGGRLLLEESTPSGGTTFAFTLPCPGEALPLPAQASLPQLASGPRRILLVEDHADTRIALQRLLQHQGHEVSSVSGVADAMAAMRTGEFDLFVSDLGLPDGSGLDLPGAIARVCGRIVPCVALSGFGTEDEVRLSVRAGYSRHLTKPVNLADLEDAIATAAPRLPLPEA